MPLARSLVAGLLLALAAPVQAPKSYAFEIDGKPAEPKVWSLAGTPDRLQSGDLAEVNGTLLVLGEPGAYRFRGDARSEGRLWRVEADGTSSVAVVATRYLNELEADARSRLVGVVLDAWDEATLAALAALPLERVAVTVRRDVGQPRSFLMPALPAATCFLSIHDYVAQESLGDLRLLVLGEQAHVDGSRLAACRRLAVLDLGKRVAHLPQVVGELSSLRDLRADLGGHARGDEDWVFLSRLRELRRLELRGAGIEDAGLLADLPYLEHLDLEHGFVVKLPAAGFSALRYLNVQTPFLTRATLNRFRAAHPTTFTHLPELRALRAALAGCNRVRVRSGGTCRCSNQEEKELCVERDPAKVEGLLRAIEIYEDTEPGSCACCGNPTLELFEGEKRLVTLGIHHGCMVRWVDGPWGFDALLTEASQVALCRWLAERGVVGPQLEREASEQSNRLHRQWWQRRQAVLGERGAERLRQVRMAEDMAAAFVELATSPAERAQLAFRLLGCHEGSWKGREPIDELLLGWLDAVWGELDVAAVLRAASTDGRASIGAARFCFAHRQDQPLTEAALGVALPALAAAGLRHPQRANRAHTLVALGGLDGETSLALLRRALAGEWTPRQVPAEDLGEVGGLVAVYPQDPVRDATSASLRALAALCLASRGDHASLPAIQALEARSTGEDRQLAAQAREQLKKTLIGSRPAGRESISA